MCPKRKCYIETEAERERERQHNVIPGRKWVSGVTSIFGQPGKGGEQKQIPNTYVRVFTHKCVSHKDRPLLGGKQGSRWVDENRSSHEDLPQFSSRLVCNIFVITYTLYWRAKLIHYPATITSLCRCSFAFHKILSDINHAVLLPKT